MTGKAKKDHKEYRAKSSQTASSLFGRAALWLYIKFNGQAVFFALGFLFGFAIFLIIVFASYHASLESYGQGRLLAPLLAAPSPFSVAAGFALWAASLLAVYFFLKGACKNAAQGQRAAADRTKKPALPESRLFAKDAPLMPKESCIKTSSPPKDLAAGLKEKKDPAP